jgi:hypothetical protein
MRIANLIFTFALTGAVACASERVVASQTSPAAIGVSPTINVAEVPLLYVVDGVRYQRDQIPSLSADQVLSVSVVKGHLALQKYGPEAAYGVVVVTTKAGRYPQT